MQKFFTGDKVLHVTAKNPKIHIITECEYQGNGQFQYSTNLGAWFDDKDFVLTERATPATFKELDSYLNEEENEPC